MYLGNVSTIQLSDCLNMISSIFHLFISSSFEWGKGRKKITSSIIPILKCKWRESFDRAKAKRSQSENLQFSIFIKKKNMLLLYITIWNWHENDSRNILFCQTDLCDISDTFVCYLIWVISDTEGKHNFFVCATENIIEPFLKTQNLDSNTESKTKCSKHWYFVVFIESRRMWPYRMSKLKNIASESIRSRFPKYWQILGILEFAS